MLGRREAAGEAAGFDTLRADREVMSVEADRATAATDRARAQAILASFLATPPTRAIEAVRTSPEPRILPALDELIAVAERSHGELVALERELEAAGFAERAAAASIDSGTGGRRGHEVVERRPAATWAASSASMSRCRCSIAHAPSARPRRRAHARFGPRPRRSAATLRAQIMAWRAAVAERREMADRFRAAVAAGADQIERIAQVSYEAGEGSILELLDAYRTASAARIRLAELDAAVREAEIELEFVSGWEIP